MANKKVFRDDIAQDFINSLQESPKTWKKQWSCPFGGRPYNAITGKSYRGVNAIYLSYVASKKGYTDPRWCTFKQISNKNWHLQKGSKGSVVELWMPYDKAERRVIPWSEYDANNSDQMLITRYYTVFNANQIDGIPELEKPEGRNISELELIDKISVNMGVEILHDGVDRSFYAIADDKIHLPEAKYFDDTYAYHAVVLHELSHATGHASRLNRNIENIFGTQDYAFEELVAEISSCFLSSELDIESTEEHKENHVAYVQSWISQIKEKPESLFQAIKLADQAATYLEIKAELVKEGDKALSVEDLVKKNPIREDVSLNEEKDMMPAFGKTETGRKNIAAAPAREAAGKERE